MTENTGRLVGKVVIVTGGNSGMGASTVEMFVAEGARVVITARGEEAENEAQGVRQESWQEIESESLLLGKAVTTRRVPES